MIVKLSDIIERLIDSIFVRFAWVGEDECFWMRGASKVPSKPGSDAASPWCCVMLPGTYVESSKQYKAVSKKELYAILKNEVDFLSPFEVFRCLYEIKTLPTGTWNVNFYFIDANRFHVWDTSVLLIGGRLFHANEKYLDNVLTHLRTPVGAYVAVKRDGNLRIKPSRPRVLSRWLETFELDAPAEATITISELKRSLVIELYRSVSPSVIGAYDFHFIFDRVKKSLAEPKRWLAVAAVALSWILIQTLYLFYVDWRLNNQFNVSAEARSAFVREKTEYLDKYDQLLTMLSLEAHRSRMRSTADVLLSLDSVEGLELNRFEFRAGEIRISGDCDSTDKLTEVLASDPRVKDIEFLTPITPNGAGGDRFNLKFMLAHD